jgi:hypothetical protein
MPICLICCAKVENHLAKSGEKLPYKATTPLSSGYHPEIDVSSKLGESEASYFHSLVGVLWWIVELGCVDIKVEVSMMSSHLALLRAEHLKEIYHIFTYLKVHLNTEMVFDPMHIKKTEKKIFLNMNNLNKLSKLQLFCDQISKQTNI